MRKIFVVLLVLGFLAPVAAGAEDTVLLEVDNGDLFYDLDGDCVGDTDDYEGAEALRHWHVGLPFLGPEAEVAGGMGCLDGGRPQTYGPVEITDGAVVSGRIRYTWDTNVPGGCCNDVHLHIYDASGDLVASTLETNGLQPVVPEVLQVREHELSFELGPGTYTFVEDVFSGEHSAWLTRLVVTGA